MQLLIVSNLRKYGLSLQRIRRCVDYLRREFPDLEAPLAALTLVTDGETIFHLTADAETVMDTVRAQFVWSVPIAALLRRVRQAVGEATAPHRETIEVAGREFTVTMEQDPEDGWWVGLVEDLPGCGSQGADLAELREMVADAVREYLIARGDLDDEAAAAQQRAV